MKDFLICESKLDNTFPNNHFMVDHYKMFSLDQKENGIGLIFHTNEKVPYKIGPVIKM